MSENETNGKAFTQKDLMQHLLNVAQHAATREDLAKMRQEFREDSAEMRKEFREDLADTRKELNAKFDHVDAKFDRLDTKIDSLRKDMNTNTWKLLGGMTVIITVLTFLAQALTLTTGVAS